MNVNLRRGKLLTLNLSLNYKLFFFLILLASFFVLHSTYSLLLLFKIYYIHIFQNIFHPPHKTDPCKYFCFFISKNHFILSPLFSFFQNHPQFSLYVSKTDRVSLGSHLCPVLQKTVLYNTRVRELLVI